MLGEFWQELLGSVGSLLNGLTQTRQQREYVFVDSNGMPPLGFGDDVPDPSKPAAPPMWVQAQAQLQTLQKADPNFLETTFLTQATKVYSAVLAAEGAMSADATTSVVTPDFLDRFKQRIAGWRDAGLTRVVSDVNLDPPTTFKANIGGDLQTITVRFTGSARRFTKDDMTNLVSEGSAQAESFTEFATFTRTAGSTTPKSTGAGGAIHCPSCGAPADAGALRCTFCGAPISGSGGTWLLDHTSVSAYT